MAPATAVPAALLCLVALLAPLGVAGAKPELLVNPGCGALCSNATFGAIAVGALDDTTLLLWSSVGTPVLAILSFEKTAIRAEDVAIDWASVSKGKLGGDALTFKTGSVPVATAAYVMPRILQFEDAAKKANVAVATNVSEHSLVGQAWSALNESSSSRVYINMTTEDSVFQLLVSGHAKAGTTSTLPHLFFKGSSFDFSLIIKKFKYTMPHAKLAQEVFFVSNSEHCAVANHETVDDEYSPSIFKSVEMNMISNAATKFHYSWKPAAYGGPDKDMLNLTFARIGEVEEFSTPGDWFGSSVLASSLFGDLELKSCGSNISFGEADDGNYRFPYLVLDTVVGPGKARPIVFSKSLMLVLIVTLGGAGTVLLIGAVFLAYKKLSARRAGYETIN